ncbi:MAG: phosphatase PAP2 family protein [Anaerolineaceae bacterium]|nr:phosphatase PAP2 family protein [Anaerolineaceae bacterium]
MPTDRSGTPMDETAPDLRAGRRGISLALRRLIFIVALAATLGVFLLLLPVGTRLALVRSLFAQRSVVLVLLLFSLVTLSLLWSAGQRFDAWLFLVLNLRGYHSLWMDRIMWVLTQLGSFPFAALIILALALTGARRAAILLIIGQLTLWMAVETMKVLTDRSRPFTLLETVRVIGWKALGLSFPSGHTAQSFFLATLLTHHLLLSPFGAPFIYALALLVGFTRIYVGAHYPRDVLGGALLGSVWGVMAILIDTYLQHLVT